VKNQRQQLSLGLRNLKKKLARTGSYPNLGVRYFPAGIQMQGIFPEDQKIQVHQSRIQRYPPSWILLVGDKSGRPPKTCPQLFGCYRSKARTIDRTRTRVTLINSQRHRDKKIVMISGHLT